MALPSLRHLELYVYDFVIPSPPTHLPILLPNILHLRVKCNYDESPHNVLSCIQAENLVALSLSMLTDGESIALNGHFPSLQHLLLANAAHSAAHLVAFARSFPSIGRLTFAPGKNDDRLSLHNLNQTLGIIIRGAGDDDTAESNAHSALLWSKLQSIALPTSTDQFSVTELESTKGQLQVAGHPIRKLLLPQKVHSAMVEIGEVIEIGEYYVDWPTTFEQ
ncbi:hypothetical protein FIBSPDRAFT_924174 [Athelia psychrophila]|uniref:Uncharacterized protein n=1 Tax=Athelia psychrophila TaxID=1759441 RepID=A0A166XGA6_9AGAM|nr:hypothetical protein FIBSPDRAFT_924174 [Fibularhizoctonia sp. CBS 109695]